ncbi:MAG: DUF2971 domain-containing protein [Fuerstiella sp.]
MSRETSRLPKLLYHYTSIEAFKSIIDSRKMRASRYDQMNDDGELKFGVKQLLHSLERRSVCDEDGEYAEFLTEGIRSFESQTLDVYVLSLSAAGDNLEQWRAYCPCGGVAIGFDSKWVQKGFLVDVTRSAGGGQIENPVRPNPANQLLKCKYSRKDGTFASPERLTDHFFVKDSYAETFRRMHKYPGMQHIFMASLSASIYRSISQIKHGAYKAEKEWRSVNSNRDPNDYPEKLNEKNRFYIEYSFDPADYINNVCIAPHGDTQGALNAVEFLRATHGLGYSITRSSIPFRTR